MNRTCPDCGRSVQPNEVTGDLFWVCTEGPDCCWYHHERAVDPRQLELRDARQMELFEILEGV